MGSLISYVCRVVWWCEMSLREALAQALRATALVVILSLAWGVPAIAHQGHAAPISDTGQSAAALPKDVLQERSAASIAAEAVNLCGRIDLKIAPLSGRPQHVLLDQACCGTLCTSALINGSIAAPVLRSTFGLRLALPSDADAKTQAPGLPPRPPRRSAAS